MVRCCICGEMTKHAASEVCDRCHAEGVPSENSGVEPPVERLVKCRGIPSDDEWCDLVGWPCQQLLGGLPPYALQGVDENGRCKHPECDPRNDDRDLAEDQNEFFEK